MIDCILIFSDNHGSRSCILYAVRPERQRGKTVPYDGYLEERRKRRWKNLRQEEPSKNDESVVAWRVRTMPMGSITNEESHIPSGPRADSRTAFSAIMPTT